MLRIITVLSMCAISTVLVSGCYGPTEGVVTHKDGPQGTVIRCEKSNTNMCYVVVYTRNCKSSVQGKDTRVVTCTDKVNTRLSLPVGASTTVASLPDHHSICFTLAEDGTFPQCIFVPGWLREEEHSEVALVR